MPTSTSMMMASILAQQFVKLQAPPCSGSEGGVVPLTPRSTLVSYGWALPPTDMHQCGLQQNGSDSQEDARKVAGDS